MKAALFVLFIVAPVILASYMPTKAPWNPRDTWKYSQCTPCECDKFDKDAKTVNKRRNLLVGRYGFRIGKRGDEDYHYPEVVEVEPYNVDVAKRTEQF